MDFDYGMYIYIKNYTLFYIMKQILGLCATNPYDFFACTITP